MRITKRRCESEQIEAGIKYSHTMDCTNLTPQHKSSNIILNDINVEIIYNPVFYCIFILYIIGIAGFPLFILFFNKFYITCILAQDNGLSIVMELIIITLLAAN